MNALFDNIATILGFGFIGLSFLMLFLGYRALREVVRSASPSQGVISLARLFLCISFAFLVAAGPLHLTLLWAESEFLDHSVTVKISMPTRNWQESFGEIGIWRDGRFLSFTHEPLDQTLKDAEELLVNVDHVVAAIQEMRAQIQASTEAVIALAPGAPSLAAGTVRGPGDPVVDVAREGG